MTLRSLTRTAALRLTGGFLTGAYYPMYAWNRRQAQVPVTILTFHKICNVGSAGWNVSPHNFAAQMEYLFRNAYCVLGLSEYLERRERGAKFSQPTVIITFDDGYESVYRNAYPVLAQYRFPATLFLVPSLIGSHEMFPWDAGREEHRDELMPLKWEQVSAMRDGGMEFGSHSLTHPHLARLSPADIEREVTESKARLEERLDKPVETFAYPGGIRRYGDFDGTTREALLRAGYRLACTSELGRNTGASDLMQQRRIFVQGTDSVRVFAAKVEGAFDWMFYGQKMFQNVFPDPSIY